MELSTVLARRRMCRNFLPDPLPPGTIDRLIVRASRAPSAGHTQGWDWLVLEGPQQTGRFWELDAEPAWRASPDHPGLLRAPAIVIPLAHQGAYHARYAEPDKAAAATGSTGPGASPGDWDTPYWLVDTSFATMLLLLGAVEEGLGALFFRLHRSPTATLAAFGVPSDRHPLGALALGRPADELRSPATARRSRRPLADQIHRGHW